jgi:hypothetical protein
LIIDETPGGLTAFGLRAGNGVTQAGRTEAGYFQLSEHETGEIAEPPAANITAE